MIDVSHLNLVYSALADATRRAIIMRLSQTEMTIKEVRSGLDISKQAVSKHVQILERAGLLVRRIDGRSHYCRLHPDAFDQAEEWMRECRKIWMYNLDQLERHLMEGRQ